jgi:hypothetical protein
MKQMKKKKLSHFLNFPARFIYFYNSVDQGYGTRVKSLDVL